MAATDDLIASLSGDLAPVRRLRPPALRAALWIAGASVLIAALVLLRGLRADFAEAALDPAYWVQVAGAWAIGATATLAAFNISLPDRPRGWMLLPLPAACLWLTGFAYGCLGHWIAIPFGAPVETDSVHCLETIGMASVPMALGLWLMLRQSRPLRPGGTAWMGGLAIAGFADTAHLFIHVVQASLLVMVINIIPATVIVLLLGVLGRRRLQG